MKIPYVVEFISQNGIAAIFFRQVASKALMKSTNKQFRPTSLYASLKPNERSLSISVGADKWLQDSLNINVDRMEIPNTQPHLSNEIETINRFFGSRPTTERA